LKVKNWLASLLAFLFLLSLAVIFGCTAGVKIESKPSAGRNHYRISIKSPGDWYTNNGVKSISCVAGPWSVNETDRKKLSAEINCAVLEEVDDSSR